MPKPENTCPDCGEWKKEQYELCYECSRNQADNQGRICECGNFKNPEYDTCFECHQAQQ